MWIGKKDSVEEDDEEEFEDIEGVDEKDVFPHVAGSYKVLNVLSYILEGKIDSSMLVTEF